MKLLALDTSTDQMSLAVLRDGGGRGAQLWQHSGAGGALASSTLLPQIEALMAQAGLAYQELDAIAFGQGPGSFTGLRTACSVAQGLAFGAGVPVLPVDSLLAVAEAARAQYAPDRLACKVLALLDARMDQLYAAHYAYAAGVWQQTEDYDLLAPEAVQLQGSEVLAGNVFGVYGTRLRLPPSVPRWAALPTARAMLALAPALLAAGQALDPALALPRYIRDKVAQTTAERAVERATRQAS